MKRRYDLVYSSTKTYTHSVGLSCCFRQWRAASHCKFLHGYAIQVRMTFCASKLDVNNWVVDFGGLKSVKKWLEKTFDHKLLVAEDDPQREQLVALGVPPYVADVVVLEAVGCEAFARHIFDYVEWWLAKETNESPRVYLFSVEVREHEANSAIVSLRTGGP